MLGWEQLFVLAAEALAKSAGGKIAGESVNFLLLKVMGQQATQAGMLQSLRQDIRAIMEGPWYTGEKYLRDAAAENSVTRCLDLIKQAEAAFREADGNLASHQRKIDTMPPDHFFSRAIIASHVVLCALCRGSIPTAQQWLKDAYQFACLAEKNLEPLVGQHLRRREFVDKTYDVIGKTYDGVRKGGGVALGTGVVVGAFFPPVGIAMAVAVTLGGVAIAGLGIAATGVNAYEEMVLRSPQAMQQLTLLLEVKDFLKALTLFADSTPSLSLVSR